MTPCTRAVRLIERLKYVVKVAAIDPFTGVAHGNPYVRVRSNEPDFDTPLVRREFDRIEQKVPYNLLQSVRVTSDDLSWSVKQDFDIDSLCFGGRPQHIDGGIDHAA